MREEDGIEVIGMISEVMPNSVYWVQLPNGHRTLAHLASEARMSLMCLGVGAKVKLELSPFDLSQARIVGEVV